MASTGFAADFARRPIGQKIGIFVVIAILLAGLYYQFVYSKLKRDLQAAEDRRAELVASEAQVTKDEKEADTVDKQLASLKTTIEGDAALPTAAQLPAFFDMLNRKVGEAGVEVTKWDYQSQIPVDEQIDKVPVEIEVHGTFYQLEKFFYLLYKVSQKEGDDTSPMPAPGSVSDQEKDRILTVENLHIGSPEVKNNQLILTADFRASTFRKEEPVPDETAAPAKPADKKPAAGAGSASGTAPNGMLGLPQKEKEKVQDALQKDEDRANGGPAGSDGADRVKGGM